MTTTTDTSSPTLKPTIRAIAPASIEVDCSENGVYHAVHVERSGDLGLASKVVHGAVTDVEAGTLLIELNIDGEGADRVMVNPSIGVDLWEVLLQARDVIGVAIEAHDRLRKA